MKLSGKIICVAIIGILYIGVFNFVSPGSADIGNYGIIAGTIMDEKGKPISGAEVYVLGSKEILKKELKNITNGNGNFKIKDVPPTAPRYIIEVKKDGYITDYLGDIDVNAGEVTRVSLELLRDTPERAILKEEITLKAAFISKVQESPKLIPAENAVLDPSLYPPEVKPYLRPGEYINSTHPEVVAVANQILSNISEEDRAKQTKVAKAVFDWLVKNVKHEFQFKDDITAGMYSTHGYGAWGTDFADWIFTPEEMLRERRGICIAFERLASALLRALNIPAREVPTSGGHPGCQWWVQLPDGNGYWANFDSSHASNAYNWGNSNWQEANFPAYRDSELRYYSINEDEAIHMEWDLESKTIWIESKQRKNYELTAEGLNQAKKDLEEFRKTGEIPGIGEQPEPTVGEEAQLKQYYSLQTIGFNIKLFNLGEQRRITAKFPIGIIGHPYRKDGLELGYWTNHPEWVARDWSEEEYNPETEERILNYFIEFDLTQPEVQAPFATFFGVVLVPGVGGPGGPKCWQGVVDFVEKADQYDAKLTLLFSPQWAEYVLGGKSRLELVKEWQANGHEIGLHHHTLETPDWDGYTNHEECQECGDPNDPKEWQCDCCTEKGIGCQGKCKECPRYEGTIPEMMEVVNKIASPEELITAVCGRDVGTDKVPNENTPVENIIDVIDFPDQIIYDVDGITDSGLFEPLKFIHNQKERWHLRVQYLVSGNLGEVKDEFESAQSNQVMGVSAHDYNVAKNHEIYEDWFKFVSEKGYKVRTVSDIMSDYLEEAEAEKYGAIAGTILDEKGVPPGADTDKDSMPDTWENQYGLNPLVNDANEDKDGDDYTNKQEYDAGTNPIDATSHPIQLLKGTIKVIVTDEEGNKMEGVTINVSVPLTATKLSDSDGMVVFSNLTLGTYTITASKSGYKDASKTVTISETYLNESIVMVMKKTGKKKEEGKGFIPGFELTILIFAVVICSILVNRKGRWD